MHTLHLITGAIIQLLGYHFLLKKKLTEPDVWICAHINPWIEDKIKAIADFVIKRHSYMPIFEASKTVRNKTVEERTHVDVNGKGFIEYDMYSITQYSDHEVGKELFGAEKNILLNYKLEENTLDSEK